MKVDVMKIRQMSPESFALYLRENDFHTFRFDTAEQTTPAMHTYSLNEIYTDAAITNDSGYSLALSRIGSDGLREYMKIFDIQFVSLRDCMLYIEADVHSEFKVLGKTHHCTTRLAIC